MALGGTSGAAGYGVKKGFKAASRIRRISKISERPRKDVTSKAEHWFDW